MEEKGLEHVAEKIMIVFLSGKRKICNAKLEVVGNIIETFGVRYLEVIFDRHMRIRSQVHKS